MNSNLRWNPLLALALGGLLALLVLALAWPRLSASVRFRPVDLAIEQYHETREIPTHRLQTLIGFAGDAVRTHGHYRYHDGRSFLHLLRGLDIYTPALERRGEYRLAEQAAIETVKRAPAQPEAWLRIAMVRAILRDEPEAVLEPWKMSVFTGRTHSTLMVPRVGVGLPYLEFMDAESRGMLKDQLQLAWALKPRELLRELQQRDPRLQATRQLIAATNPSALAEMEERIENVP
jgi:hypothetical protein